MIYTDIQLILWIYKLFVYYFMWWYSRNPNHAGISLFLFYFLLFWLSLLLPLPEVHSDGTQSVYSLIASSAEAFQLLQRDLTKISCPLLNYNLPSTSLSFSPSLPKNWPPSLFCCQLICVFVCARHVHVCVKLPQLPAEGVFEMIGGARIWSGSAGRSRAKASTFCSLLFFSSISLFLPVIMTSCLLHGFLLSLSPYVAPPPPWQKFPFTCIAIIVRQYDPH